jgi:hypothetical protein
MEKKRDGGERESREMSDRESKERGADSCTFR